MGRKDKHRPGQSRNNAVFKVVGGFGKAKHGKNKAKEVELKLKKITPGPGKKGKTAPDLATLDAQLVEIRSSEVKMSGADSSSKKRTKITPIPATKRVGESEMDSITETLKASTGSLQFSKEHVNHCPPSS